MSERLIEVRSNLSESILTAEVTERFAHGLIGIGRELSEQIEDLGTKDGVVVCIPRGGVLVAKGVYESGKYANLVVTNDGMGRVQGPLLNEDFPDNHHYILVDGILASGKTIRETIGAIRDRLIEYGHVDETKFTVIAPVISSLSVQEDGGILSWAEAEGINLTVITSHVEPKYENVVFGGDGGKPVLVVGQVYRDEMGRVLGCAIGDFGDMTMEAMAKGWG